jgi:hypothetical protein
VGAVEVVDGDGCPGREGARRWGRGVAGIMAELGSVLAQEREEGTAQVASTSAAGTGGKTFDHGDGDGARAS